MSQGSLSRKETISPMLSYSHFRLGSLLAMCRHIDAECMRLVAMYSGCRFRSFTSLRHRLPFLLSIDRVTPFHVCVAINYNLLLSMMRILMII